MVVITSITTPFLRFFLYNMTIVICLFVKTKYTLKYLLKGHFVLHQGENIIT